MSKLFRRGDRVCFRRNNFTFMEAVVLAGPDERACYDVQIRRVYSHLGGGYREVSESLQTDRLPAWKLSLAPLPIALS
jgi:hypothetical protein